MRLETNKFNFTKRLINEKISQVSKKMNEALKNNRGDNIVQDIKNQYYDLVDISTKLFSIKVRKF